MFSTDQDVKISCIYLIKQILFFADWENINLFNKLIKWYLFKKNNNNTNNTPVSVFLLFYLAWVLEITLK